MWRLAGYYHTTHATPRLMAEAAERFAANGRHALARYALEKVRDESGHDELALADLRALGYCADTLFAVMVIMAITTTLIATPLFDLVSGSRRPSDPSAQPAPVPSSPETAVAV